MKEEEALLGLPISTVEDMLRGVFAVWCNFERRETFGAIIYTLFHDPFGPCGSIVLLELSDENKRNLTWLKATSEGITEEAGHHLQIIVNDFKSGLIKRGLGILVRSWTPQLPQSNTKELLQDLLSSTEIPSFKIPSVKAGERELTVKGALVLGDEVEGKPLPHPAKRSNLEIVKQMFRDGRQDSEIALKISMSVSTVRRYRKELGLTKRRRADH